MNKIRNFIPNLFTLGNVAAGSLAIYFWSTANWNYVFICFIACLLFDFMDGFVARLLKATSNIGKDLDSLADLISFGLLPGLLLSTLLEHQSSLFLQYIWILQPVLGAYRLARFNNEEESKSFTGIPIPLNALFVIGVFYSFNEGVLLQQMLNLPLAIPLITLIASFLMVSTFKGLSNKLRDFSWKSNQYLYLFTFGSIILFILFKIEALALIYPLYIVISGFKNVMHNEIHSIS